jgi:pantoate--beta-alanine ligase
MKIITPAVDMSAFSTQNRSNNQSIAFVPTMGALHKGHISLIQQAQRNSDVVVVSVFVNPTQFNNSSDLEKYPRTFDQDKGLLSMENVDAMFYPTVSEVYPTDEAASYELDGLDEFMEGPNRPGHFDGVVQVVSRLFDMVQPDSAFFGEKDFQQLAILKHMSSKLGYAIKVVGCPTIREQSGLAMSSRNQRLSESGKTVASSIFQVLSGIKNQIAEGAPIQQAKKEAVSKLNNTTGLELEYLEIVNPHNLRPTTERSATVQACIAAWVDGVRLIDNMRVK